MPASISHGWSFRFTVPLTKENIADLGSHCEGKFLVFTPEAAAPASTHPESGMCAVCSFRDIVRELHHDSTLTRNTLAVLQGRVPQTLPAQALCFSLPAWKYSLHFGVQNADPLRPLSPEPRCLPFLLGCRNCVDLQWPQHLTRVQRGLAVPVLLLPRWTVQVWAAVSVKPGRTCRLTCRRSKAIWRDWV